MIKTHGIYIHIPFCHSKCNYCNFYSVVNKTTLSDFTDSLKKEITSRKDEVNNEISTIYFGGGTPSLFPIDWFKAIFEFLTANYKISPNAEITIETNPSDLNVLYLKNLSQFFNRISIGVQSFNDTNLKYLNRKHNAQIAISSIKSAQDVGLTNISVDLIYGLPSLDITQFQMDINTFISLQAPHLSAYSLSVEKGTKLYMDIEKQRINIPNEDCAIAEYQWLMLKMNEIGFVHYEISNFALPGFESNHNSSYWEEIPYIGFGPSAHSYNGDSRRWNVSSLSNYIKGIETNNKSYFEEEILSQSDKLNEYLMTGLRTNKGINLDKIEKHWGLQQKNRIQKILNQTSKNLLTIFETNIVLTDEGKLFADKIASDLFD